MSSQSKDWDFTGSSGHPLLPSAGVYVITGPLFEGKSLQHLNDRVMVPTSVYKLVYFPDSHRGAACIATNEKDATTADYAVVAIAELEQRVGLNLLPGPSPSEKQARAELPAPEIHGRGRPRAKGRRTRPSTWIVQ